MSIQKRRRIHGWLGAIGVAGLLWLGCGEESETACGADCADSDSTSDTETGTDSATDSASDSATADTDPVVVDWDWHGIIGTGQSLALGTTPVTSTTQPFNNLKLDLGALGDADWPFDASFAELRMVPLVEPIRAEGTGFPRPYPINIWGETPHSAMGNQISELAMNDVQTDYATVHTVVAESGQSLAAISKGAVEADGVGRAYAASMFELAAIRRLAAAEAKTFGVGAIVLTNGEADWDNDNYKAEMIQLWQDYNTDIAAATGQVKSVPLLVSQMHSIPEHSGSQSTVSLDQWTASLEYPGEVIVVGPKYQYDGYGDGIHLSAHGYQQYGDKLGEVYYEKVVRGRDWQPLSPIGATKSGNTVTVQFHVPEGPLVFDDTLSAPHQTGLTVWAAGRGFEVRDSTLRVTIESVEVVGDSVVITCDKELPEENVTVAYALTTGGDVMTDGALTIRWGQLRDSNPRIGYTSKDPLYNWAVAFEMPVE